MLKRLERADLVLAVFDGSRPLSGDDISLLDRLAESERLGKKEIVPIINNCDLEEKLDCREL